MYHINLNIILHEIILICIPKLLNIFGSLNCIIDVVPKSSTSKSN